MDDEHFHVRFTPLAYEDMDEIDDYISVTLGNLEAAEKLLSKIEQELQHLTRYPRIGAQPRDTFLASKGYRKLVVENYLVFYILHDTEHEVVVMRVLYGAREYRSLL